jgi:hypothetical protein
MKFLRSGPSIILVVLTPACVGTVALGGPADAQATSGSMGFSGTGSTASGSTASGTNASGTNASGTNASGSTASGANTATGVNGAGTLDGSAGCLPLSAAPCPPDWTAAVADEAQFCVKEAPFYDAVISAAPCRGLLRYTRFLFDAGPRYCVYDPGTLALQGYYAYDGKAGFQAITCGSTAADYDITGCAGNSCPKDAAVNSSGSSGGPPDAGTFACGTTTCSGSHYCVGESGGPRPPPDASPFHAYSCAPIPSTCTTRATCACVVPYVNDAGGFSGTNNACTQLTPGAGFGYCLDDGAGHVTLECGLP